MLFFVLIHWWWDMSIIFRIALWNTCFTKFFVESRDLFFERLGVVRTRVDQANSKGSGGLRTRKAVNRCSKACKD